MDPSWTTYYSAKIVTEDPLPNFKPILTDGRPMRRDESYYGEEEILRKDLIDLLKKFVTIRSAASSSPLEENAYIELLYAIEFYGKYAEESNLDWKLLDLVKCLESLGNMKNILNGESNRCQSAGKINYALRIRNNEEKSLIEKAYKLRSNRAAHSPTGVSIDRNVLIYLQRLSRKIINDSLSLT